MHPTAVSSDSEKPSDHYTKASSGLRLPITVALFGAIWVILAGPGDPLSWIVGLPAVIAATWSHRRLSRGGASRLSFWAGVRLFPFFVYESFKGGIDVARRVIGRRLKVDPGLFDFRIGLRSPAAQVLFIDLVSLLPGTLSADLRGDTLRVHALDRGADSTPGLRRLERLVAAVFGEPVPDPSALPP